MRPLTILTQLEISDHRIGLYIPHHINIIFLLILTTLNDALSIDLLYWHLQKVIIRWKIHVNHCQLRSQIRTWLKISQRQNNFEHHNVGFPWIEANTWVFSWQTISENLNESWIPITKTFRSLIQNCFLLAISVCNDFLPILIVVGNSKEIAIISELNRNHSGFSDFGRHHNFEGRCDVLLHVCAVTLPFKFGFEH